MKYLKRCKINVIDKDDYYTENFHSSKEDCKL